MTIFRQHLEQQKKLIREYEHNYLHKEIISQMVVKKQWTAVLDKQLIYAYESGCTRQEIADLLNASWASINIRISRLMESKKIEPKNRKWSKEENKLFTYLWSKGLCDKQLAKVFDCTNSQVANHRNIMGMKASIDEDRRKIFGLSQSLYKARGKNDFLLRKILRYEKNHNVKILNWEAMTNKEWLESEIDKVQDRNQLKQDKGEKHVKRTITN